MTTPKVLHAIEQMRRYEAAWLAARRDVITAVDHLTERVRREFHPKSGRNLMGFTIDQLVLMRQGDDPNIRAAIGNEQMYGRFMEMWATVVAAETGIENIEQHRYPHLSPSQ